MDNMYLDPVYEYRDLYNWIQKFINRTITPKKLINSLKHQLTKGHNIRVKLNNLYRENLDEGDFTIGAEYDCELDQLGKKPLILDITIKPDYLQQITLTKEFAENFVLELVEALVHEYQHQHQYRARRYKLHGQKFESCHKDSNVKAEQEYFGDPDEIDAYSANIAARIFLLNNYIKNTELSRSQAIKKYSGFDMRSYVRCFGKDHKILTELNIKIKENLDYLEGVKNGQIRRRKGFRKPIR